MSKIDFNCPATYISSGKRHLKIWFKIALPAA